MLELWLCWHTQACRADEAGWPAPHNRGCGAMLCTYKHMCSRRDAGQACLSCGCAVKAPRALLLGLSRSCTALASVPCLAACPELSSGRPSALEHSKVLTLCVFVVTTRHDLDYASTRRDCRAAVAAMVASPPPPQTAGAPRLVGEAPTPPVLSNWNKSYFFTPAKYVEPTTVDEIQAVRLTSRRSLQHPGLPRPGSISRP